MQFLRPSARRPLFYGWIIAFTALLMNFASAPLNAAIFAFFVTPMSEDLGWSRSDLSWAYTLRLGVAGACGPLLGILLDRFGGRVLGSVLGLIAGLCVLALAGIESLAVFYVLFAISGFAGFGAPAGQLLTTVPVSKWFHVNRGRALAIATIGMPIGVTVFMPVCGWLIDAAGWRETWAILGVLAIGLIALPCALLMRKDPESIGQYPDGFDHPPTSAPVDGTSTADDWTAKQVLRSPTMWMIVAALTCSGFVLPGTALYRVAFWEDVGLSATTIALVMTIDPFMVTLSALAWGFLADRIQTRYIGFFGGLVVGASMLPMIFVSNSVLLLVVYTTVWGIGMGANVTVNNIIWPNYYGRRFLGTIRGVVFPFTVGASAISAPVFAGLMDSLPEERYVWVLTLAAFWVSALLLLIARRPTLPAAASTAAPAVEAAS